MNRFFAAYLEKLRFTARQGDATRESFYPALAEIRAFCRVVTALQRTLDLQAEIDRLYPGVERETLAVPAPAGTGC